MTRNSVIGMGLMSGLAALTLSFQACSGMASAPGMSSSSSKHGFELHNGGTTTDNPKPTLDVNIKSYAQDEVRDIKMCVKEIKFGQTTAPAAIQDSAEQIANDTTKEALQTTSDALQASGGDAFGIIDYTSELLEQTKSLYLDPAGTYVSSVDIPYASYSDVVLMLGSDCAFGSLQLQNKNGYFAVQEPLQVRFRGQFPVAGQVSGLQLDMEPILAELAKAKSPDEVRAVLNSTFGTLMHY